MPRNIEIKARVHEFDKLRRRAEALSDTPCEVIPQEDIFFDVGKGRLKLRILGHNQDNILWTSRINSAQRVSLIFQSLGLDADERGKGWI